MHFQSRLDKLSSQGAFIVHDKDEFDLDDEIIKTARAASVSEWVTQWENGYAFARGLWHFVMLPIWIYMFLEGYSFQALLIVLCYSICSLLVLKFTKQIGRSVALHVKHDMLCAIVEGSFDEVAKIHTSAAPICMPSDTDTIVQNGMSAVSRIPNIYLYTICMGIPVITLIAVNKKHNMDITV